MTGRAGGDRASVPPELAAWIERYGGISPGVGTEAPVEGARRALGAALAGELRSRQTAYALLAADGLITSAVEDMAGDEDPSAAFLTLLKEVARDAAGGPE